jgi:hypothetical protein
MSKHIVLALFVSWLAGMSSAHADVRVSVVDTDPAGQAVTLGRDESFYVRIEFAADEPIRIWARPYFEGKEVLRAKSNGSSAHLGAGYALGWFSLDGPSRVDEVRIRVGGGTPYREWEAARYPVQIVGTGLPAAARASAAWVDELLLEAEAAQRRDFEQRMNQPVTAWDTVLMSGFMLTVLGLLVGGFVAPAWALWKWRQGWRMAASVPAALMGFVVLRIVVETAHDPTSHNLWPFEVLIYGTISLAFMTALKIARRFAHARN